MTSDIKRILVCNDGSSNSNRAAAFAADIAKKLEANVTVLFVVSPSDHDMLAGKATGMDEGRKGFGEQRLEKATTIFKDASVNFDTDIEFGNAAEKVLMVSERGYDSSSSAAGGSARSAGSSWEACPARSPSTRRCRWWSSPEGTCSAQVDAAQLLVP